MMTSDTFFDPLFDLLVARYGAEDLKNALDTLAVAPGEGDALGPTATAVRQHLIDDGIIQPFDRNAPDSAAHATGAAKMLIKGGYIDDGHRTLGWYRELMRRVDGE